MGAGLSGVLVPSITRKWQDHKTELDLKVQLVDKLSESVTSIVMATIDATSMNDKMKGDIIEYHKGCSYITARIEPYFYGSNDQIATEWRKYDDIIQKFYHLPEMNEEKRSELIEAIRKYAEGSKKKDLVSTVNWEKLKGFIPFTNKQEMAGLLRNVLFDLKHDLMRDIMNSDIVYLLINNTR